MDSFISRVISESHKCDFIRWLVAASEDDLHRVGLAIEALASWVQVERNKRKSESGGNRSRKAGVAKLRQPGLNQ